jgi:hypothetical protein
MWTPALFVSERMNAVVTKWTVMKGKQMCDEIRKR